MADKVDPLEMRMISLLTSKIDEIEARLLDKDGNWAIRGFIDVYKSIFPMTSDTKVLSKVMEMILIPVFLDAINDLPLTFEFAEHQNHYPDLTVTDTETGSRVAIDLKSTYFTSDTAVNGFTLGAFTGYFRDRESTKNVKYPYGSYEAHLVFGVLYHKLEGAAEGTRYTVDNIDSIPPVAGKFRFLVQPKWAIAGSAPGSGNTKNIGSIKNVDDLLSGRGPFTQFKDPESVFDDYWMNYLTADMAREFQTKPPYRNIETYMTFKSPPELSPGNNSA